MRSNNTLRNRDSTYCRKALKHAIVLIVVLLIISPAFALDVCSLGKEALSLTSEQQEEFYKKNIKDRVLEGEGFVRNVWKRGYDKSYAVAIDCGNDVVVNVAVTADVKNLKEGQQVNFDGTCISYGKRRYIYSQKTYLVFELGKGSVRQINHGE